ncbi:nickel/cobalt efflux transporter [Inquilinus sp. YAF38]|uniref:nickel/cobalt efflux transporter n=1 Tax=Inquilinus sp. YAF38 TaxID=3233084 RepID=UPI003F915D76
MTPFAELVQQSATAAWLFVPSAILLGALHGLEPGHSKTMMAAFIVAIRGTFWQAALLAITATISHTAIVWLVALLALTYGPQWGAETTEPYFQFGSAVIIIGVALWMAYRTWHDQRALTSPSAGWHRIDTGPGLVELSIQEDGVSPRFQLRFRDNRGKTAPIPAGDSVVVETLRPDGARQVFELANRATHLESVDVIPEPHEFVATVAIAHGDHAHTYPVRFVEDDHGHAHHHSHGHGHDHGDHDHGHGHSHGSHEHARDFAGLDAEDAHARAHAEQIRHRFAGRKVTTGQIALFGLTGGLIPCPAAVTVLLLCLQLQKFWLGIVLVLCFSVGLALTLLASGTVAAWGVRHATNRWPGFEVVMTKLPYMASAIIILVGLYVGYSGLAQLV